MSKGTTIEVLCAQCRNEDVHTEWVTRLALRMFDASAARLGWGARERRLLEAAGRLHDIGYAEGGMGHAPRAVARVLETPLAGFTTAERRAIAGIMQLHGARLDEVLAGRVGAGLPSDRRTRRLGAILRVADGLDYGHIQNTDIRQARWGREGLVVRLRSPVYAGNVLKAEAKAELWRHVMPGGIRFVVDDADGDGAVRWGGKLTAIEAARRLLFMQYRAIQKQAADALVLDTSDPLHDLRVTARRARALLRWFQPELPAGAADLIARLGWLCTELGPDRDEDVWLTRLGRPPIAEPLGGSRGWGAYVSRQRRRVAQARRHLRTVVKAPRFRELTTGLAHFLRVELPAHAKLRRGAEARAYLRRRLRRAMKALREEELGDGRDVEALHEARRRCRSARYGAEFAMPVLGEAAVALSQRLKRAADALGDVHDLDVALVRVRGERMAPPGLLPLLRRQRRDGRDAALRAWARLRRKRTRRLARRALG